MIREVLNRPMLEFRDYIGNDYIRGFLQGAVRKGLDPHAILGKAGISAHAYEDPQAQIDGIQLYSLILAIEEATNDMYLGFLEYPTKPPMGIEVVRHGLQSETLGEAAKATSQFVENYRDDFSWDYLVNKKSHEFCLGGHFRAIEGMDDHFLHFYRLSNAYRFHSWLIGNRIKLTRVRFFGPQPEYCYDYGKLFHCDIQFDQPECQLCFDAKYLNSPVIRTEADLLEYAKRYNDWLEVPGRESSLTSQIEQILLELQKENCPSPSIEAVADIISLHPRTLRRILARENETFQKIKDRMWRDLSVKLLLNTDIPVATVAEKVGFAEPGNFTRAFVRWTGSTPSEYRMAHARG